MLTRSATKPTVNPKATTKKSGSDRDTINSRKKQSANKATNLKATAKKSGGNRVIKPSRKEQVSVSTGTRSTSLSISTSPSISKSTSISKPSDGWGSYEGVDQGRRQQIRDILKKGDWDFLCSEAVKCFQRHLTKQRRRKVKGLSCNISHSKFACGLKNLVLEVAFSDSTYWIVRIRFPGSEYGDEKDSEKGMHSEVATMRLLQKRTSIPVSTIFGYDARQENPFGYRYMFMSVLPGRPLQSILAVSVPEQQQAKVAEQLADILHQLNTRMTFDKIGWIWCGESGREKPSIIAFNTIGAYRDEMAAYLVGPFATSLEYFYAVRQHENAAVRACIHQGNVGKGEEERWHTACRALEQMLTHIVLVEKVYGPFPLKHMDLHHNNILVDDDFNITGIIDWTAAQTVPCESLPVGVEFVQAPRAPEELKNKINAFCDMIQTAWKEKELETECVCRISRNWARNKAEFKCTCSIADIMGSARAELLNFFSTFGAVRRTVGYANIVTPLLYGPEYTLDHFSDHWGAELV